MLIFKGVSFFLRFSNIYKHHNLEVYSSLYSEGFYWGVCWYIIHSDLYNILFIKTWWKMYYFLSIDNIFWFMEW